MDRPQDRDGSEGDDAVEGRPTKPVPATYSSTFLNSLALILIGASLGVFWREVFQLTIRALEMLGG